MKYNSSRGISPVIGTILLVGLTILLISATSYFVFNLEDDVEPVSSPSVDITSDELVQLQDKDGADKVVVRSENNESEHELKIGQYYEPESGNYSIIGISQGGTETLIRQVREEKEEQICNKETTFVSDLRGDGTTNNPYQITNECELQAINQNVSSYYELANNIDASNTSNWNGGEGFEPIGDINNKFTGGIDGNNYKINNLYINKSDTTNIGLITYADDAEFKNLTISNANITGESTTGGLVSDIENTNVNSIIIKDSVINGNLYVGGISGRTDNDSKIVNSSINADITGFDYTGGLIGESKSDVENIYINSTIQGNNYVGGAIGYVTNDKEITNYKNIKSNSKVQGNDYIGGLIGAVDVSITLDMHDLNSEGLVYADNEYGGGLIGKVMSNTNIYNASSTADIDVKVDKAGGLVAYMNGNIYDSNYEGNINSGNMSGGITQRLDENNEIVNSHSSGNINSGDNSGGVAGDIQDNSLVSYASSDMNINSSGEHVGGLIGEIGMNSNVEKSYSKGDVSSNMRAGGLIGIMYQGSSVSNSYAQGDVILENDVEDYAGGLVALAHSDTTINTSYSIGSIYAEGDKVGILIGESNNEVINSYYLEQPNIDDGIGDSTDMNTKDITELTIDEMTGDDAIENMSAFDFENIWISIEDDYPQLRISE